MLPCGSRAEPRRVKGQSPLQSVRQSLTRSVSSDHGSAGTDNSIQTRRCAQKSKGTALFVSVCSYRDYHSQRRQGSSSPALPETESEHRERTFFVRLRTRRGSGATGKPPRQGGRLCFRPIRSRERELQNSLRSYLTPRRAHTARHPQTVKRPEGA